MDGTTPSVKHTYLRTEAQAESAKDKIMQQRRNNNNNNKNANGGKGGGRGNGARNNGGQTKNTQQGGQLPQHAKSSLYKTGI